MMHLLEGQKNIAYLSRIEELLEGIYERLSVYICGERTCSLIVTARGSAPSQVLNSTPVRANIIGFNGHCVLLVVGVVPVDNETSVMTSSILRICRPSHSSKMLVEIEFAYVCL